jgi:integrase
MTNRSLRVPKNGLHKGSGQAVVRLEGKDVYLGKHGTPDSRHRYDDLIRQYLLTRKAAAPAPKTPPYRLHKTDGRAVVTLDGRDFFLGAHGTPENVEAYNRLIAAWIVNGRRTEGLGLVRDDGVPADLTIVEVIARFLRYAIDEYPNSNEVSNYGYALKPLKRLFGAQLACEFSPKKLKLVQQEMVGMGWCRTNINKMIGRVRAMFRWPEGEVLVPKGTWHNLKTLKGVRKGRVGVKESVPVRPVTAEDRLAIRDHVSRQVWNLTQLQYLTGARAGELLKLRAIDTDTTPAVWRYAPERHKNAHRGHGRVILFGPQAQEILRTYLGTRPVDGYLFSAAEAEREWRAAKRVNRKTKVQPSQVLRAQEAAGRARVRAPGDCYTIASYRRAIERGCAKAGIPAWTPHRLRHSAATDIRRVLGLESACAVLGHNNMDTTLLYAELEREKAQRVIARVG